MPTEECFMDLGKMQEQIAALRRDLERTQAVHEADKEKLARLVQAHDRLGTVFWLASILFGSAISVAAHFFDLPAIVKKAFS